MPDARRHRRIFISLPVRFMLAEGSEHRGLLYDMSPGGVSVTSEMIPPMESRIVLYIDDLDRCRPETVLAVINAVRLLADRDSGGLRFVLAFDPDWLAAHLDQAPATTGDLAGAPRTAVWRCCLLSMPDCARLRPDLRRGKTRRCPISLPSGGRLP